MTGVLVVDKPSGITSHDVVAVARRALGERSIGHTGTLDPLATGVLPLACGKATRLVRFFSASDKDYDATIRFGVTTDTYDITGTRTAECPARPTRAAVEAALAALSGDYDQMPPPYSAKKVAGRRAYDMARHDVPVVLKAVPVRVTRAALVAFDGDTAAVAITCSSGFYVRSLAHELGRLVGTGACLDALRRTRSGDFTLAAAVPFDLLVAPAGPQQPERIRQLTASLLSPAALLPELPSVRLTAEGLAWVSHGRDLGPAQWQDGTRVDEAAQKEKDERGRARGPRWVRLLDQDGALVAMASPGPTDGALHPSVVLI
jgi:tRNA pseudouridine55 synthase